MHACYGTDKLQLHIPEWTGQAPEMSLMGRGLDSFPPDPPPPPPPYARSTATFPKDNEQVPDSLASRASGPWSICPQGIMIG